MKQDGRHKLLDIQYIMHSLQISTFTSDFTTMSRKYRALPVKRTHPVDVSVQNIIRLEEVIDMSGMEGREGMEGVIEGVEEEAVEFYNH